MRKFGHKGKKVLLWLFLAVSFFPVMTVPCQAAGLETFQEPRYDKWDNTKKNECKFSKIFTEESNHGKWWEAPLKAALNASIAVGNNVFDKVAGGAKGLMYVGAGLWLAIFSLKIVGGMVESDPLENLTKVGGMMLKVGIAAVLLGNRQYFFGYFFSPIVEAGAGFVGAGDVGTDVTVPDIGSSGGLADAANAALLMAQATHDQIASLRAAAGYLQCADEIHNFSVGILGIDTDFGDVGMWTAGCAFKLGTLFFMAAFPFFLIDACFRMGVTAALCPLFIVAWVFEVTRSYAGKGFNATLNVAFVFMMVKITAQIAMSLLKGAAGLDFDSDSGAQAAIPKLACRYRVFNFTENSCDGIDPGGSALGGIFGYFVCVAYGLLLMGKGSSQLANYFSEASFSNDTAFQAAKGAGQAAASGAHMAVRGGAQAAAAAGKAHQFVSNKMDRAAARTVEAGRRKMESGGTLSKSEQKRYSMAENRLQRKGFINQDGSENKSFGGLLTNSRARNMANKMSNLFGDGTKFQDKSQTYQQRKAGDANLAKVQAYEQKMKDDKAQAKSFKKGGSESVNSSQKRLNSVGEKRALDVAHSVQNRANKPGVGKYQPTADEAAAAKRMDAVGRKALKDAGIDAKSPRAKAVQDAAINKYLQTPEGRKDMATVSRAAINKNAFEKSKSTATMANEIDARKGNMSKYQATPNQARAARNVMQVQEDGVAKAMKAGTLNENSTKQEVAEVRRQAVSSYLKTDQGRQDQATLQGAVKDAKAFEKKPEADRIAANKQARAEAPVRRPTHF